MYKVILTINENLVISGSTEEHILKGILAGERIFEIFGISYSVTNIESSGRSAGVPAKEVSMEHKITASRLVQVSMPYTNKQPRSHRQQPSENLSMKTILKFLIAVCITPLFIPFFIAVIFLDWLMDEPYIWARSSAKQALVGWWSWASMKRMEQ